MWNILRNMLAASMLIIATHGAWAQCGVTMSCGTNTTGPIGTPTTPKVCAVQACFASAAALQQYEKENSCKFASDALCGDKPLDKSTQCCGKDANTGKAKTKDRQVTVADPKFNWDIYKKECIAMRQSEAPPDALWSACKVGEKHSASDDWPVKEVISFPGKPNARTYCVDGCSTPPSAVNTLWFTRVFMVKDKDNPSGFPTGSFYNACAAHDICYQSCVASYTQNSCDQKLLDTSIQACNTIPLNNQTTAWNGQIYNTRDECVGAARAMNLGLRAAGEASFNIRKQQYCQCC